MRWALYYWH